MFKFYSTAFLLPGLVMRVAGAFRGLPTTSSSGLESFVGPAFVGAVLLAAIVPAVTIMASRRPLPARLGALGHKCGDVI